MKEIQDLLYAVCENEAVYRDDCDLIEEEILDSLAIVDLFTRLEDIGIEIPITRIDRNRLRTVESIQKLIEEYR